MWSLRKDIGFQHIKTKLFNCRERFVHETALKNLVLVEPQCIWPWTLFVNGVTPLNISILIETNLARIWQQCWTKQLTDFIKPLSEFLADKTGSLCKYFSLIKKVVDASFLKLSTYKWYFFWDLVTDFCGIKL